MRKFKEVYEGNLMSLIEVLTDNGCRLEIHRTSGRDDDCYNYYDVFILGKKEDEESDVVAVVRCKDCKHWKGNDEPTPWSDGNVFVEVPCETKPTDFCSWGERKEDDDNL